jgi:hypothetical protein
VVQQHGPDPARQLLPPRRPRLQPLDARAQQRGGVHRQQPAHAVAHDAGVRQPEAALQQAAVAAAQRLRQQHRQRVGLDRAVQQHRAGRVGRGGAARAGLGLLLPLELRHALAQRRPAGAGAAARLAVVVRARLVVAAAGALRGLVAAAVVLGLQPLRGCPRPHELAVVGGPQHLHVAQRPVGGRRPAAAARGRRARPGRGRPLLLLLLLLPLLRVAGAAEQQAGGRRRELDGRGPLRRAGVWPRDGHALKHRLGAVAPGHQQRRACAVAAAKGGARGGRTESGLWVRGRSRGRVKAPSVSAAHEPLRAQLAGAGGRGQQCALALIYVLRGTDPGPAGKREQRATGLHGPRLGGRARPGPCARRASAPSPAASRVAANMPPPAAPPPPPPTRTRAAGAATTAASPSGTQSQTYASPASVTAAA